MTAVLTQQIADRVGGELSGQADLLITGVEQIDRAKPGHICFIRDAKFAAGWATSKASAVLANRDLPIEPGDGQAVIHVEDADLALGAVLQLFAPKLSNPQLGIHPQATVAPTAQIGQKVAIGPHSVIAADCVIGDGCVIHPNVTILERCQIGAETVIWPGTVIRERCVIGSSCILHPNVTIGADGFGYRPTRGGDGLVKIPQIGIVRIGDEVEIGAGTCVDRGKFSATVIGDGTKIDNLCHIAHNCQIGRYCIVAGQVGLAGSVVVGDGVVMGGKAGVRDQVTIGRGAQIAAYAAVVKDVPPGEIHGGYPAREMRVALRENAAIRKLPDLIRKLKSSQ